MSYRIIYHLKTENNSFCKTNTHRPLHTKSPTVRTIKVQIASECVGVDVGLSKKLDSKHPNIYIFSLHAFSLQHSKRSKAGCHGCQRNSLTVGDGRSSTRLWAKRWPWPQSAVSHPQHGTGGPSLPCPAAPLSRLLPAMTQAGRTRPNGWTVNCL